MSRSKEMDLTTGNPFWSLLKFAIPVILGNLFQLFYTLADSVIVGKTLGADSLAAVGSTSIIIYFVFCFINGFTGGFGICLGQRCGARDERGMRKSIAVSTILSVAFAVVLTVLCCVLSHQIIRWMKIPADIAVEAYAYMFVVLLGTGATVFYNMISNILRALGDSKTPLYFLVFSSVLNIFLDILFILPLGMGVAGAAWATILSQFLSAVLSLLVGMRRFAVLHLRKADFANLGNAMVVHLKTGFPMGFQMSVMCIGQLAMQMVVNSLGTAAVAGYTAASKADQLSVLVNNAMMTAISNYVAQNFGAGKRERICQGVQCVDVCGHYITEASDCRTFHVQSDKGDLSLFGCISDDRGTVLCDTGTACCVSYYYSEYAEWLGTICSVYDRAGNEDISNSWTCWNAWLYISMHCKSYGVVWSMCITDSMLLSNDESMEKR